MDGILSTDYCYVFFLFFYFFLVDVEGVECMGVVITGEIMCSRSLSLIG